MSKILEHYNKSPFENIGKKLYEVPKKYNIPVELKSNAKSKSQVQKDFNEIIVPKYKTILELNSLFGDIKVNPTTSIVNLFSKINYPEPIRLSSETNFLKMNSSFDDIRIFESNTDDKLLNLIEIKFPNDSSVLNSKLADIKISNQSNLLESETDDYVPSKVNSVLNFNSNFDDIVNSKITSVLDFNSNFDDIVQLPYSNVLSLDSKFNDIIIEDISSVLKLYIASRLSGTVPGVANFFDDIHNTGFTLNAEGKKSLFKYDTVLDFVPMKETKEKSIIEITQMEDTAEKPVGDINPPVKTLEKRTALINSNDITPEKIGIDVSNNIITPQKIGIDVSNDIFTPEKFAIEINNISETPNKFTLDLYGFNFNDDSYGGVLNQYAVYFATRGKVTDLTYKQIIEWANRRTISVPEANDLYSKGFHTPKIPSNQVQLIIPPYDSANDRLPIWANTYLSTLEDMSTTLISGFLDQRTIDLLDTVIDVDISPLKKSPVIFHQLAGEVYWKYHEFGNVIRNVREELVNIASDFVGETLARQFIPKVENTIAGGTSLLINKWMDAPIMTEEKILMMYHILMGTKYTTSKAFHDRTVPYYSSNSAITGNTAVNLFDDANQYTKYAKIDSTDSLGQNILSIPEQLSSTIRDISSNVTTVLGETDQDNSQSPLKSLWYRIAERSTDNFKIPVGYKEPALKNDYLIKHDSATFGNIKVSEKNSSINSPIEDRIFKYDVVAKSKSIDKNYPSDEVLNEGGIESVKGDLSVLVNNNISKFKDILSTDFSIANTILPTKHTKEGTYTQQITNRLNGEKKLLNDRGFPSIGTQFSDEKNRTGLLQIDSDVENRDLGQLDSYDDTDLVDFYFEDISSLTAQKSSILIPFRAIITNIGDSTTANWAAQDYLGRADKFWIYQGFQRDVNLQFEVAINSKDEFIESWRKINYLQGMCYPTEYPNNITLKAPIMALTLGNLFNRVQVILTNINLVFDGETMWELEKGYQLPMHIKISTTFIVLFADVPQTSANHYAQNQGWISPVVIKYNKQLQSFPDTKRQILATDNSGSLSLINENTSDISSDSLKSSNISLNKIKNNIPINEKVEIQSQISTYEKYRNDTIGRYL